MSNNIDKIRVLIEEYYEMEDGKYIENYQEEMILTDNEQKIEIKISRKVLKHVVEKRKKDRYTKEKLLKLFTDTQEILNRKSYKIVSNKPENDNSFLFLEMIAETEKEGVVLVLEIILERDNLYFIKTGFYKPSRKIKRYLR